MLLLLSNRGAVMRADAPRATVYARRGTALALPGLPRGTRTMVEEVGAVHVACGREAYAARPSRSGAMTSYAYVLHTAYILI